MTLSTFQQLILAMNISQYLDPIKVFSPENQHFSGGIEDDKALLAMKLMVAGTVTPEQVRALSFWGVKHCVDAIRETLKRSALHGKPEPTTEAIREEINKRIKLMEENGVKPFDDIQGEMKYIAKKGFTLNDFRLFQYQHLTYPQISSMFGLSEKEAEIEPIPAKSARFALQWARAKKHFHVSRRLLETREDVFGENIGLKLYEAVRKKDTTKVKTLVGREDSSANLAGLALREAGYHNHAEMAGIILDTRKDIPAHHLHWTLRGAVACRYTETASTLLEKRHELLRYINPDLFSRAFILITGQAKETKPPVSIGHKVIESRATAQTNGHSL